MPFQNSKFEQARQTVRRTRTIREHAIPAPSNPPTAPVAQRQKSVFDSPFVVRRKTATVFVACPACDATGLVATAEGDETCPVCNGDTRITRAQDRVWQKGQSDYEAAWERSQP